MQFVKIIVIILLTLLGIYITRFELIGILNYLKSIPLHIYILLGCLVSIRDIKTWICEMPSEYFYTYLKKKKDIKRFYIIIDILLLLTICILMNFVVASIIGTPDPSQMRSLNTNKKILSSLYEILLLFFDLMLVALSEEVARSIILNGLVKYISKSASVLITILLFGFAHGPTYLTSDADFTSYLKIALNIGGIALPLTLYFLRFRNLRAPIWAHCFYDLWVAFKAALN